MTLAQEVEKLARDMINDKHAEDRDWRAYILVLIVLALLAIAESIRDLKN